MLFLNLSLFCVFTLKKFDSLSFVLFRHERTPVDEAAVGGKMDVIDAINTAVTQVELTRTSV